MGILGNYLPNWLPDDPNQRSAAKQGLLAAGAALLGGRGDLGGILGDGLMAGSQGYQGALAQQQQAALRQAQMQQTQLENQKMQAATAQASNRSSIAAGVRSRFAGPSQTATAGVAAISELPRVGQSRPSTAPNQQPGAAPDDYQFYTVLAQELAAGGDIDGAKDALASAKQFRPALKAQEARMVNGQRVMVNVYEDGRTEQVEGFAPDAEKLHFANTGGSTVGLDQFTGKPVNTIANTQSPDSRASVEVQKRGQNMIDARAKQQLEQGKTPSGYRQGPNGTLVPIEGGPADPRIKPPTEFQGKSASFGARAEEADRILTGLQGKYSPAAINSKNAVESTWLVGGALGAATNKLALSETDQQAEQAQRDFVNAVLRQESGAAIGPDEFNNARRQYFPQPGDTPGVIAQKAANRKLAIQGFQVNAGQAAFKAPTKVKSRDELPKKPTAATVPADIGNLLNKYGAN